MGLHYGNNVSVERADFRKLPALEGHVIVANPPYGIRMGGDENLEMFFKNLGDFLKHKMQRLDRFCLFRRTGVYQENRVESIMEKIDQDRRA